MDKKFHIAIASVIGTALALGLGACHGSDESGATAGQPGGPAGQAGAPGGPGPGRRVRPQAGGGPNGAGGQKGPGGQKAAGGQKGGVVAQNGPGGARMHGPGGGPAARGMRGPGGAAGGPAGGPPGPGPGRRMAGGPGAKAPGKDPFSAAGSQAGTPSQAVAAGHATGAKPLPANPKFDPFYITWIKPSPPPYVFGLIEPVRVAPPEATVEPALPYEVREEPALRVSGIMSGDGVYAILEELNNPEKVSVVKPGSSVELPVAGGNRTYEVKSIDENSVKLQSVEGKVTYTQIVPLSDAPIGRAAGGYQGSRGGGVAGAAGRPGSGGPGSGGPGRGGGRPGSGGGGGKRMPGAAGTGR